MSNLVQRTIWATFSFLYNSVFADILRLLIEKYWSLIFKKLEYVNIALYIVFYLYFKWEKNIRLQFLQPTGILFRNMQPQN